MLTPNACNRISDALLEDLIACSHYEWLIFEDINNRRVKRENHKRKLTLNTLRYSRTLPNDLCGVVFNYMNPDIPCISKLDFQFDYIYNDGNNGHKCSHCYVKIYNNLYKRISHNVKLKWFNWRINVGAERLYEKPFSYKIDYIVKKLDVLNYKMTLTESELLH